jgi:hypothetical protein
MKNTPTDPVDGKPGLRIETAASYVLRDFIRQHMAQYGIAIRRDRLANAGVVAAYIDALAGAIALTIAGGHGSRDEVMNALGPKITEAIDRDLAHLANV